MTAGASADTPADTGSLRIMVCPHDLVMGGSQLSAIDLAATLKARGHEVEVFAPPGPILPIVHERGLAYVAAPTPSGGFDARSARALAQEVRRFRPDIVHTFESWPTMASVRASRSTPHRLVVTVMSMSIPDYLPDDVPLTVGTGELAAGEEGRPGAVVLLEPPIDAEADAPGETAVARAALGLADDAFVVAVVGRLSREHEKAAGVAHAIRALSAAELPVPMTLLVAGAGDDADAVADAEAEAAASANGREGRLAVRLLGNVDDPRRVYDAADVVFGMGGSALRAMSHAKPLIVQGKAGFWELLTPQSVNRFLVDGYFGDGPSGGPGVAELIAELAVQPGRRVELGAFGRRLVVERYALTRAAEVLEQLYRYELATTRPLRARARARRRSLARFAKFRVAIAAPWLQSTARTLTGRRG
ncbi:glycosyltransferase family 4 protein [Microbacterium sp. CH12i]|uniref:glycosyltransferase family 4 protein n=1 Tax=Microbacterium sp. CH12i TaxID=1479651 RepID=UPI0013638FA5|nr:glycosyltransferase family 4 protein [Microbacterium sp. CH12i]